MTPPPTQAQTGPADDGFGQGGAYRIGLTGGIGCGKSTVANLFAAQGIVLIDADELAHRITAPGGDAIPALVEAFGPEVLTPEGAMNRAWMRERAFADQGNNDTRVRLESILHPLIRAASRRAYQEAASPYVLFVVPLLFESGDWKRRMQRILVVDCPVEAQIARVQKRSGLPEEQIRAIMAKQASREQRLALTDDVVDNGGDGSNLPAEVGRLHARYLELARQARESRPGAA